MDYRHWLNELAPQQTANIASHVLPSGEKVWIRKIGKSVPAWRYRLLGLVRLLGLGALQPIPNLGGQAALDVECARLSELSALGIPVPRLLAKAPGCQMISHLGNHQLGKELAQSGEPLAVWRDGLAAIAEVHRRQACLSQAFARNMVRMENGVVGFIDFEDNPSDVLPLPVCQSRDWLCYLQSTLSVLKRQGRLSESIAIWQDIAADIPAEVWQPVARALGKIRWLRHFQAAWLGSDTARLAAMAEWFHILRQR